MSWMSNWVDRVLGKSSVAARVESVVARVEPAVWEIIRDRVPMGSVQEVHGYVWANSAMAIRSAVADYADELSADQRQTLVRQARTSVADRIVSQLEMYAAPDRDLRRAA